jgi:hypothetical protein
MTVMLHTPEGDLPLGATLPLLSAIGELTRVARDREYPHLYGLIDSDGEELEDGDWAAIQADARGYLERETSHSLSLHARWVLHRIVRGPTWLQDLAMRAWQQHHRAEADGLRHLVRPSTPILFFGDSIKYLVSAVRIITVGLNPSRREFPRDDPFLRFRGCSDLSAGGEVELSRYLQALGDYFRGTPYKAWFNPSFEEILRGMDASYYDGGVSTAVHTDLCSPLATDPTWTGLELAERAALKRDGVELWHDLVEELQPDVVLVSVRRDLLAEIRFPELGRRRVIHTVSRTLDGTKRKRPYEVEVVRRRLASGKEPLFAFGRVVNHPFGSVSAADQQAIGARIQEAADA